MWLTAVTLVATASTADTRLSILGSSLAAAVSPREPLVVRQSEEPKPNLQTRTAPLIQPKGYELEC